MDQTNQAPPPKKSLGCLKSCGIILLVLVLIVAGNYVYKHFLSTTYIYKHNGQNIFSLKYKKVYKTKLTQNQKFFPNTIADDLIIQHSCFPLDVTPWDLFLGDCWANTTLRFMVAYPGSEGFYQSPEDYVAKGKARLSKDVPFELKAHPLTFAGKQFYWFDDSPSQVRLFTDNYSLEIGDVFYKGVPATGNRQGQDILSTLKFY